MASATTLSASQLYATISRKIETTQRKAVARRFVVRCEGGDSAWSVD